MEGEGSEAPHSGGDVETVHSPLNVSPPPTPPLLPTLPFPTPPPATGPSVVPPPYWQESGKQAYPSDDVPTTREGAAERSSSV